MNVHFDALVLCIDDEPEMLNTYHRILHGEVARIILASSASEGIALAESEPVDLVLLDLRMPEYSGLEVLRAIKAKPDAPEVIIITAYGSVGDAVEAMKLGAADFIEKPFSAIQLRQRIKPLLRVRELEMENRTLRELPDPQSLFPEIIGISTAMRDLKATIAQLAVTDVTVMITGESGTGKELVARALHNGGPRREKPFVVVDCGSLPESMIESELFGYRKGAFTGAAQGSLGLFRAAEGGTLFLDEVAELPLAMQTRLLRSVQNREVRPVGATHPVEVDVRIVAASNVDLRRAVEEGRFREDLFYRLTAVILHVPALRDHPEDLPLLASHFSPERPLSEEALKRLGLHNWPGNIRELENVIRGACALTTGPTIEVEGLRLPDSVPHGRQETGNVALVDAKDAAIDRALTLAEGNKRKAAQILGVAESTIYRNLKRRNLL